MPERNAEPDQKIELSMNTELRSSALPLVLTALVGFKTAVNTGIRSEVQFLTDGTA